MITPTIPIERLLREFAASSFRTASTLEQYEVTIRLLQRWDRSFSVLSLTEDNVAAFLRWYSGQGVSANTVRRKRRHILTLWRFAADRGLAGEPCPRRIPQPREQKRVATSWEIAELAAIVAACRNAQRPHSRRWSPAHWEALVRTLYDTGHRVGAVMRTPLAHLDWRNGTLIVGCDATKTGIEQQHRLGQDTLNSIRAMGDAPRQWLFEWPRSPKYLQKCFRRILVDAGLPAGSRDLFHKIRRTSYTAVYAALGPEAASRHAGHTTDMSAYYLDRARLQTVDAIDVLKRF